MSKSAPTPREIGTKAYLDSESNTLAGLKVAFDAYDAALITTIEDISDDAPSTPYDNGGTQDGWRMACAVITARIHALAFANLAAAAPHIAPTPEPFQQRVDAWLFACFGETIARDKRERDHRLLEEALETVQSGQCTRSEAHQLVDYVFGRPVGEPRLEVGGVMNTLAAWCSAYGIDLNEAAEAELARVWTKVEAIRAKQAAKPKHSPLPVPMPEPHIAAPDWRPIESDPPPKDGTVFDVWLGGIDASDAEFYCTPGTLRSPSWHWKDGKFRPFLYAWSMPTFVRPTHWMPLPAPPAAPQPPGSAI